MCLDLARRLVDQQGAVTNKCKLFIVKVPIAEVFAVIVFQIAVS